MALWYMAGFEGGALTTAGFGIITTNTGTAAIDSTIKRTGTYSVRFYKESAAACYIGQNTGVTDQLILVARAYFYFTTFPSSNAAVFSGFLGNSAVLGIYVDQNGVVTGKSGSGNAKTGPTITTGKWYCFEISCNAGANHYVDWRVDGVQYERATTSGGASYISSLRMGVSTTTQTFDFYVDDVAASLSIADQWLGPGRIYGLVPNGDGTHNNPSNYMQNELNNPIDGSTYMAYSKMNAIPMAVTTYVKQTDTDVNSYVEIQFPELADGLYNIRNVRAIAALKNQSTGTNNGTIKIVGDTEDNIFSGNLGSVAVNMKAVVLTKPSGGWTRAKVAALVCRAGFSSDGSPDPYWGSVIIEVDVDDSNTLSAFGWF